MRMNGKIMNYKFDGSRVFFTSDTHFNVFCHGPCIIPVATFAGMKYWYLQLDFYKSTCQAERKNIPYFRQPRHQEPEAELHEILRADNDADVY